VSKPPRKPLRAKTLDAAKCAEVLALVRLGCTRRMAAARAGCAHSTIGRAAARDPAFAAALAEAESRPDRPMRNLIRQSDRRTRRAEEDRRTEERLPRRGFRPLEVFDMLLAMLVAAKPPVRRKDVIIFLARLHGILVRGMSDVDQSCPNCQNQARLFLALKELSDNNLQQQAACVPAGEDLRGGPDAAEITHQNGPDPKWFLSGF
jgi:hypothetical protein